MTDFEKIKAIMRSIENIDLLLKSMPGVVANIDFKTNGSVKAEMCRMNDGHTVKFDRPAYNADFEIYENGYLVNGFMMSHILSFNNSKSDTANWIEDMKELEQNIVKERK